MDADTADVTEPVRDEPVAPPVPWYRRPAAIVAGVAAAVLLALAGGLIWAFSGDKPAPNTALKPIPPSSAPAPAPTEPSDAPGLDLIDGLGGGAMSDVVTDPAAAGSTADAGMFAAPGGGTPLSTGSLPALDLPPAPSFQPPAPVDWGSVLQPLVDSQRETAAANLGGAIAGPVVGSAWGTANTAAIIISDLILFAAANSNGGAVLNQLQSVLPALTVPAAASSLGAPDFSGLTAAFAAAAATPPIGVPALPQLPPPPPGLPTPEQALAGLAALPAIGLPGLPPPPPGLPTPEQAAAGLFMLPAIGLPALPPPPPIGLPQLPPIGLPQLPPPPPIGLPSIGLPSIGLPSITRLLGLPF